MVPKKYAELGFEISRFGAKSQALKFDEKPIFVFDANANLDNGFVEHICDIYLKICEKRKEPVSIRVR
jgi:hypothetical protein